MAVKTKVTKGLVGGLGAAALIGSGIGFGKLIFATPEQIKEEIKLPENESPQIQKEGSSGSLGGAADTNQLLKGTNDPGYETIITEQANEISALQLLNDDKDDLIDQLGKTLKNKDKQLEEDTQEKLYWIKKAAENKDESLYWKKQRDLLLEQIESGTTWPRFEQCMVNFKLPTDIDSSEGSVLFNKYKGSDYAWDAADAEYALKRSVDKYNAEYETTQPSYKLAYRNNVCMGLTVKDFFVSKASSKN